MAEPGDRLPGACSDEGCQHGSCYLRWEQYAARHDLEVVDPAHAASEVCGCCGLRQDALAREVILASFARAGSAPGALPPIGVAMLDVCLCTAACTEADRRLGCLVTGR